MWSGFEEGMPHWEVRDNSLILWFQLKEQLLRGEWERGKGAEEATSPRTHD